jgi:hypothetical protein
LCVAGTAYGRIQEKSDEEKRESDALLGCDQTVHLHNLANSSIWNELLSARLSSLQERLVEQSAKAIGPLTLWHSWSILFMRSPNPKCWELFQEVE